ncbi:MAG: ribosome silencing factor [Campylobacterota bacterium]|nr:ribosome silencing factor [Campylobacterota bacterium]
MEQRIENIKKILDEKKAANIEVIDLKGDDYIVDCVIIATALNAKHGASLLTYLKEDLKPFGEEFLRVEEEDGWTIIDLGDTFIHLMTQEYRDKYSIEDFLEDQKNKQD